jgi:hypothetical protein
MSKGKVYTIVKYESVATNVRIGETWYVQIEPVMPGNVVAKKKITDVTAHTVELEDAGREFHKHKFRYPHYSVNFVEKISDGD